MTNKMYFLSDVHLGSTSQDLSDDREQALIAFLKHMEKDAHALYILGDLFEFWFEYKQLVPKGHFGLLSQLHGMTEKGIEIHYIAGNHDFALGSFLTDPIGMTLHWKPVSITYEGKRVFIAHGDGLNKRDWGYRYVLKPILRNPINQFLYRLVPADWGIRFAKWCSGTSRTHTSRRKREQVMQDYRKVAQAILSQGFDVVVLGHTHLEEILVLNNGTYVNVGGWLGPYPYAVFEDGGISLNYFQFSPQQVRS